MSILISSSWWKQFEPPKGISSKAKMLDLTSSSQVPTAIIYNYNKVQSLLEDRDYLDDL